MIDVEYLKQQYFTFDDPVPFKTFTIYPVMLRQYYDFMHCHDILDIDKNSIPDAKIIQMTYLEFLLKLVGESESTQYKLSSILEICLGLDLSKDVVKIIDGKELYINDILINSKDFDDIRKIILYQNIVDYDDSYVDPDIKKLQDRYNNLVSKKSGNVEMPTLEDLIICMISELGYQINYVQMLTYRKFCLLMKKIEDKIDYKIFKTAEMGGMVTFKEPIEHWIYKKKKNKFSNAFAKASQEEMISKAK